MIYDRTAEQVEQAKRIREEKVKKFQPLTQEETRCLERGFFTAKTIHRIQTATEYLQTEICKIGYCTPPLTIEKFQIGDLFCKSHFIQIINNVKALQNSFIIHPDSPTAFNSDYTQFTTLNTVEKAIFLLLTTLDEVKENYRICGDCECETPEKENL